MVAPLYISVADVRAVGMTQAAFPDLAVQSAIMTWQSAIERATRLWFYPKPLTLQLDGTDSDALHFSFPIISVNEIRINACQDALDPMYYMVYKVGELQDRDNPRIKLITNQFGDRDIYTAPLSDGRLIFRKGRQNQYVDGIFGWVEDDGSVPLLIQRAVLLLVVEKLSKPPYYDPSTAPPIPPPVATGLIREEGTDGHYAKYAQPGGDILPRRASSIAGLTDNTEVQTIVRMFRAPIAMATPANSSFLR